MSGSHDPSALDYKAIFEFSPTPCLLLWPDFTIIGANRAYRAVTLTEPKEIAGRGLFDVFPANPASANGFRRMQASVERVLRTKKPDLMPLQKYDIPAAGGGFEERHWSPLNVPVLDQAGEVLCILHCAEDVTELVRAPAAVAGGRAQDLAVSLFRRGQELDAANRDLLEANQTLQVMDQAKTDFFNDVSHELRTPLTLLLWSLEQLSTSEQVNQGKETRALATATRNAKRMLRLINTLLEFARADSGRIKAVYQPTDLATLTCELANQFRTAVELEGLQLSLHCPQLSHPVYVDREM